MKFIEYQQDNYTIKNLCISYKFTGFDNIVCSGNKIYQLPCQIGKKSYGLKEIKPKYHLGMTVYLIESKRISTTKLKSLAYKCNSEFIMEQIEFCPF